MVYNILHGTCPNYWIVCKIILVLYLPLLEQGTTW
ncbi:hypothetical protein SLEP1_g23296 [Rubroshorea leprosula]|uniref:Uncharacterized protein n=1 Tax=Rubroshorea leprosula TaxID=152421 RepID=A0AAV5JMA7_9ROSI|nr:hypothetical protein SLEP1_g23296 [Rubroshorea leprosula]